MSESPLEKAIRDATSRELGIELPAPAGQKLVEAPRLRRPDGWPNAASARLAKGKRFFDFGWNDREAIIRMAERGELATRTSELFSNAVKITAGYYMYVQSEAVRQAVDRQMIVEESLN